MLRNWRKYSWVGIEGALFVNKTKSLLLMAIFFAAAFMGLSQFPPLAKANRLPQKAAPKVSADAMLRHVTFLADDATEGRGMGSEGERITTEYISGKFRAMGLSPAGSDGSYLQKVHLLRTKTAWSAGYVTAAGETPFKDGDELVAFSMRQVPESSIDSSEMVFVGYGIEAPEYGWDDFKGLDVRGKTIVMLVGDPPIPDPNDPTKLDPGMFKGREMTYYGRWTYKFEMAAKKGAQGAILVHEAGPAGYGWGTVVSSWREIYDMEHEDQNAGRAALEAWIHIDAAKNLFARLGFDFDTLKTVALKPDFKPVTMGARLTAKLHNEMTKVETHNVVAELKGRDPILHQRALVYTAHWDHLGRDTSLQGDQIYNGAIDNATGVAALIEIARSFTSLPEAPKASILFVATTSEERSQLGSWHYVTHPVVPLESTLAGINMDAMFPWGRTRDVQIFGSGLSTMEEILIEQAAKQGRVVVPDLDPEKGRFYRSDQISFARAGIPALWARAGLDYIGQPADYGKKKIDDYVANSYHKVTDQVSGDWDLSGAAEDADLMFMIGRAVAESGEFPSWKPGSGFERPGKKR
jgi:Zn-dependent M28 family amino/carboxypeptidase